MKIAVTGAAGFIGSYLVDRLLKDNHTVLGIDSLTYASSFDANLHDARSNPRFSFLGLSIESNECTHFLQDWKPDVIFNLAAESHVDNSINDPRPFLKSNVEGTLNLLEYVKKSGCRFFQISTDEVYGHLNIGGPKFTEGTRLSPRSPYASSKASADLFVKSYIETYGIRAIITRCSNNFGYRQHSEKFIPTVVNACKENREIPVYGNGTNIRDWIWVEDHVSALVFLLNHGTYGEVYNVGANNEWSNVDLVKEIINLIPGDHAIKFVNDRPGHDFRYAIDNSKMKMLGWEPQCTRNNFIEFLKKEVQSLYHR
jgi:dTDP-glucose 4,6-dehydratase